jgi:hypothetical protein
MRAVMAGARGQGRFRLRGPRPYARLRRWGLTLVVAALAYLAWPYLALWDLDRAVADADPQALAPRVDIEAVRDEIRRKLNKDAPSSIGKLSDPFIQWLNQGIRRLGTGALDEVVTLDWVRERLRAGPQPDRGLLHQVSYAFFDSPRGFRVRLGAPGQPQVYLRMTLQGLRWRITAVYY